MCLKNKKVKQIQECTLIPTLRVQGQPRKKKQANISQKRSSVRIWVQGSRKDWQGEEASAEQDGYTEQFRPGRKDDSGVVESFWHRERMVKNLGPRGQIRECHPATEVTLNSCLLSTCRIRLGITSCPPWKSGQGPCFWEPQAWDLLFWYLQDPLLWRGFPWILKTRRKMGRKKTSWIKLILFMMPCPTPAPLIPTKAKTFLCHGPCMCEAQGL